MTLPLTGAGPSAGGLAYSVKVLSYSPIAYWALAEQSGTVAVCQVNSAQNGTYARDVSTMGTGTGIGDGNTSPLFGGASDYVGVYSATLASAFNGAEGSIVLWCKAAAAGTWTDGAERKCINLSVDANNWVFMRKNSTNNTIAAAYKAGGVTKVVTKSTYSPTAFFTMACSWSATGDAFKLFIDGVQDGSTQTGLGTWAGALGVASYIGALTNTPTHPWHGYIAHCALFDSALSDAAMAELAAV